MTVYTIIIKQNTLTLFNRNHFHNNLLGEKSYHMRGSFSLNNYKCWLCLKPGSLLIHIIIRRMEDRKCLSKIVFGPSWKTMFCFHWTCSRMGDTSAAEGELRNPWTGNWLEAVWLAQFDAFYSSDSGHFHSNHGRLSRRTWPGKSPWTKNGHPWVVLPVVLLGLW